MTDADEQEMRDRFAANLRRLRERTGMSQDDFALAHGISRSYVGRLERATSEPKLAMIVKLARALDVDFNELLDGTK